VTALDPSAPPAAPDHAPDAGVFTPTFERYLAGVDASTLQARVVAALEGEGAAPLPFRRTESHFLVWLPDGERRLWSPWLHLDVVDADDAPDGSDAARLFGRFHPAPSLWTAVMLGSLALGVTAAGGGLLAYSQWLVDEPAWGIWIAAAGLVGLAGVLGASRIGQRRARPQMSRLVDLVERSTGA